MNTPHPLSPIQTALEALQPTWSSDEASPKSVIRFNTQDAQKVSILGLADLSQIPRAGVKGPGAVTWLAQFGITLPPYPNCWCALPGGGLVARLGVSEFMLEGNAQLIVKIMNTERGIGVYPILRQEAAFALCGSRVNELLLQTCNVDFRVLAADPGKVILTSMAGVSITVLCSHESTTPVYRLWCDGTYGIYLWDTLGEIATELGGGYVGLEALP
jgi:sarcosine oxidase subunit gamma